MDIAKIKDMIAMPENPVKRVQALMVAGIVILLLPMAFCNRDPRKRKQHEVDPSADATPANEVAKRLRDQLAALERLLAEKRRAQDEAKKVQAIQERALVHEDARYFPPPTYQAPSENHDDAQGERKERKRRLEEERRAPIVVISNRRADQPAPAAPSADKPSQGAAETPKATPAPTYRIPEGTVIDAVLINALDGEFSGPVQCQVTSPVRADDFTTVLIPVGARVLGKATRVSGRNQQRLSVTFHRIEFPNGESVAVDPALGLTAEGQTGFKDKVNRHWPRVAADAAARAAITGFGARTVINNNSGTREIDDALQSYPTVTIRQGYIVKVVLSQDLYLPAYNPEKGVRK